MVEAKANFDKFFDERGLDAKPFTFAVIQSWISSYQVQTAAVAPAAPQGRLGGTSWTPLHFLPLSRPDFHRRMSATLLCFWAGFEMSATLIVKFTPQKLTARCVCVQ